MPKPMRTRYDLKDRPSIREADRALESLNAGQMPRPAAKPQLPAQVEVVHVKVDKPKAKLPAPSRVEAAELVPNPAYEGLPALIAEIADVAGLEAAVHLARERGGNRIYIPSAAGDDHWLVRLVGRDAADALMAHFAQPSGIELELPRGPTGAWADVKRRLHQMIREGRTSTEITRALGISRDMVKAHRRKMRAELEGEQYSLLALFDALPPPTTARLDQDQPKLITEERD